MSNDKPRALSIKVNILWNTLGSLVYLSCRWLITVSVVTLSNDYYNSGVLAFAMATGTIFASIALFKTRTYQVSDINGQFTNANYIAFRSVSIVLGLAVSILYMLILSADASLIFSTLAFLLFNIDEVFCDILYGICQKNNRMDYIGISQLIRGFIALGLFCLVLYLTQIITLSFFAMWQGCFFVTLFFDLPRSARFGSVIPSITLAQVRRLGKACLPGVIAVLFTTMILSLPRQVFGTTFGEESLGIYATIATPAVLIQVLCTYIYTPLITPIALQWTSGNTLELTRTIGKVVASVVFISLAIILLMALCGPWLYSLVFGASITNYLYLLTPVLFSTGLIALLSFATDLLVIFRGTNRAMLACFSGFTACCLTMNFWIDAFYMNGVTFAIITGYSISLILHAFFISKAIYQRA